MFENIENLKVESVIRQTSKPSGKTKKRKTSSFSIRVSGSMRYDFEDKSITVNAGEMIFLPQGSTHDYKVESEEDSICTIINFSGEIKNAKPMRFSLKDFYDSDFLMHRFAESWKFGTPSERYKCTSVLYSLLSYIANIENMSYQDKKKIRIITPAVEYLKKHILKTSM